MTYALDTNICIYALNDTYPCIIEHLEKLSCKDIAIPAMVAAELRFGAEKSQYSQQTHRSIDVFLHPLTILPFDRGCVQHYAVIRKKLEGSGLSIGPNDLVIAATALAHNKILVTHNTKEFNRVEGLIVEDWVE